MPRDSLKSLLRMFPYFLNKEPESNFFKSQSVTNNQFQGLYNDLHNVYRSFHLNKRCFIWKEQSKPYDYTINFVANYSNIKSVKCFKNDELIHSVEYDCGDGVDSFYHCYHDIINSTKILFDGNDIEHLSENNPYCVFEEVENGIKLSSSRDAFEVHIAEVFDIPVIFEIDNIELNNCTWFALYVGTYGVDLTNELTSGDSLKVIIDNWSNQYYINEELCHIQENTGLGPVTYIDTLGFSIEADNIIYNNLRVYTTDEDALLIPEDQFHIEIETYDEYHIIKGFPENDIPLSNEYDHDESLDEIGVLHNIPRKKYIPVNEKEYSFTEPPYNNKLSEDDYHYMRRIINYLVLYHTVPLPVAEIWKLYGILPEMENREKYLLKLFDIFNHLYYYDDSVDEQERYIYPGDRLFVDNWDPREWEHKDTFYDYSYEYGCYFFVNVNTKTPTKNQPITLSFRFLNNLGVEIDGDFLVDIILNGNVVVENYNQLIYPPLEKQFDDEDNLIVYPEISNLLNESLPNNVLTVTAKKENGEIISTENIIIRLRGCGTADYYVRIDGDDDNPGDRDAPFQTIAKALESANRDNIISIGPGEYPLSSTVSVRNSCMLLGCVGENEEAVITSENNSFFSVPVNKELTLKRLKLQSEDESELLIDSAVYSNNNYRLPLVVSTLPESDDEEILFNPSFTTENPANVTSGGNGFSSSQSNGVWSFTNARLTDGWSNQGYWECDYDLKCTGLRYIGFKILCLLDGTTIFGGWENCIATTPGGAATRDNNDCLGLLHSSIWDNPSTDWVHIHIEKTSLTSISITKTGDTANNGTVNYNWGELDDIPAFTIGAGNNGGSNYSNNKVMIRNLIVKKL